jgi:hypothetical protein
MTSSSNHTNKDIELNEMEGLNWEMYDILGTQMLILGT